MTTSANEPSKPLFAELIADEMRLMDDVIRASLYSEVALVRQVSEYIIHSGGKQYRVSAGEKIKVEQIPAEVGTQITIDQVLMVGEGEAVKIGAPLVAGATVSATVLSQGRHDKVRIFKMRRRKHYQKRQGHRQNYTELQINTIAG